MTTPTQATASRSRARAGVWLSRPLTLRRQLGDLVDNADKFAGNAQIEVRHDAVSLRVSVLGISADQSEAVLQPFYRHESSRCRATGATGLGLTIAQQLRSAKAVDWRSMSVCQN